MQIELVDVHEEAEGLHLEVPYSKADQEGDVEFVLIHRAADPDLCAVRAVQRWRAELERLELPAPQGRLFRSIDRHGNLGASLQGAAVSALVKKSATAAGLSRADFGAGSLRAGWITSGSRAGFTRRR